MKNNTWEILKASRSECNESVGREMEGCLADEGYVIAYFPTLSAMRKSNLIAAAPEMLAALKRILEASNRQMANGGDKLDYQDTNRQAGDIARSAIAKAEGKA